jgi:hypothetical protein
VLRFPSTFNPKRDANACELAHSAGFSPGWFSTDALVAETADNLRFHHAKSNQPKLRTHVSFIYQAGVRHG